MANQRLVSELRSEVFLLCTSPDYKQLYITGLLPPSRMATKLRTPSSPLNYVCRTCLHFARPSILRKDQVRQHSLSRSFTSTDRSSGIAAPPIDFSDGAPIETQHTSQQGTPEQDLGEDIFDDQEDSTRTTKYPRIIPASPSYFTGKPSFTDNLVSLQTILRKYQTLPTLPPVQAPRVAWRTLPQYRVMVGEPVKASKYYKIVEVLRQLNRIHPALMPEEVTAAINHYKRDIDPFALNRRPQTIDADGRSFGAGRRKASTAKVYLVEGEGEVLVNGKTLNQAFPRVHDRESAIWALKSTGRIDKYNVWAIVQGGGLTGQAESLTLAVAKALLVHEPALKPALRRGELYNLQGYCGTKDKPLANLWLCSGLHNTGSKKSGEKKAWPRKSKEDAGLGKEVMCIPWACFVHKIWSS